MHAMPSDARAGVIQHIQEYALERMAPEQLRLFLPLVERYYDRVAAEDLVARALPDLFCFALLGLFKGYFPGYSAADANPDMGDSAIVECLGLGGFSMAAAPAVRPMGNSRTI